MTQRRNRDQLAAGADGDRGQQRVAAHSASTTSAAIPRSGRALREALASSSSFQCALQFEKGGHVGDDLGRQVTRESRRMDGGGS